MSRISFTSVAVVLLGAMLSMPALAQHHNAPVKPYKPVAISLPTQLKDSSFDTFRRQIADVAKMKDRAALAKHVVAQDFFWLTDKGDRADKTKSGIDNLTAALDLAKTGGSGWDSLVDYSFDSSNQPKVRNDVFCAPADPIFNHQELENLIKVTGADLGNWGYPLQPGIEVHNGPHPGDPIIDKLGWHFVHVLADESSVRHGGLPVLKVVTPSGKVGFVLRHALVPLGKNQLCYIKNTTDWKIIGYIGGDN